MNTADRFLFGLFTVAALAAGLSLFTPAVQQGEAGRGVLGALDAPSWVLPALVVLTSVIVLVLMLVNMARRKKGRPPI